MTNIVELKSNYLNVTFQAEVYYLQNERGEENLIIKHASLEDILYNQLPKALASRNARMNLTMHPVQTFPGGIGFLCSFEDSFGRKIVDTGEAYWNDLDTIGKRNLIRTAKNRAMDSALIKYLNLPKVNGRVGKIYSSVDDTRGMKPMNPTQPLTIQFGSMKGHRVDELYQTESGRNWLINTVYLLENGQMNSVEGLQQLPQLKAFLHSKGVC